MAKKQKIEEDFNQYMEAIERETQEGLKKIQEKIDAVKKEATKVGETLESENSDNT